MYVGTGAAGGPGQRYAVINQLKLDTISGIWI